jgi:lysozyme family protein
MKPLILILIFFSTFCKAADFEQFFPHVIQVEGIMFTVTKYDRGGATKFGITYATYKTWCQGRIVEIAPCDKDLNGRITVNDLRLTVIQDVKPIYKSCYWDAVKADEIIHQDVAELIVDYIINSGCGYKNSNIKAIQRLVGVKADGKIGAKTLKAINESDPTRLYNALYKYRLNYYYKIAHGTQKKFLKGWKNRLQTLKSIHKSINHEKVTVISPISIFSSDNLGLLRIEQKFIFGTQFTFCGGQYRNVSTERLRISQS